MTCKARRTPAAPACHRPAHQGRLGEVGQQDCHGVEAAQLLLPVLLQLDAGDQLSQDDQVHDDGGRQQRVLWGGGREESMKEGG